MRNTKRQNLPPGLWIVATPIGNLSDLSPRAEDALRQADFILCEDTRRTAILLSSLEIPQSLKKLVRLDAHSTEELLKKWVEALVEGKSLALVSDAGTPAVSDPGANLVKKAVEHGVRILPIPGPSAPITLLSVSGFSETGFSFHGFFPRSEKDQNDVLKTAESSGVKVHLWFESPHRIQDSLKKISETFPDADLAVGKELTKIHEKIFYGNTSRVYQAVDQEIQTEGEIGEWCFGICLKGDGAEEIQDLAWIKALECLLECNVGVRDASKKISHCFGIPKNQAYEMGLNLSLKKSKKEG